MENEGDSGKEKGRLEQHVAALLGGGGISGAGGRAYRLWRSGERWLFICLELCCVKVTCTNRGGEKTLHHM